MKIGLYIEHGIGNGVGGAELMMAHLASEWSRTHEIHLIHHRPPLTRERIESFSSDNFERVTFRYVPREQEVESSGDPVRRFLKARDWHRAVSEGYDLFVNCTHWLPCFCHAKKGVLLVLFPFYVRPEQTPEIQRLPLWKRLRHSAYYDWEWRRRVGTYRRRCAISEFAREWTRRRWMLDSEIIYPPVDIEAIAAPKEPLIVSVGRFSTMAHTKKQMEMMCAFRELTCDLPNWTYATVGGLNTRAENHEYFAQVRAAGSGYPTIVEANVDRARVKDLMGRGRIFWHATGLGEDPDKHPELSEHFGIATVEAMAAGCVPVVINRGGQSNIVRHGETGFLWHTVDELKRYSLQLARDPDLCERMAVAARARAATFSRPRFVKQMTELCLT
jgi:glycosyltransferase involved in cell wall biosynthesis